jgi:16S rRNA (adenine1518-N6/adenine1519-N6)-dimethyltransferase
LAQTKTQILALLAKLGMSPRHRFGQNFMIDTNLVRSIAQTAAIHKDDLIIEIGPGTGTLTEELLDRGAHVLAVEIDRDLAKLLADSFASNPRFRLIEGDALDGKHALNPELVRVIADARRDGQRSLLVANLPYNIASRVWTS